MDLEVGGDDHNAALRVLEDDQVLVPAWVPGQSGLACVDHAGLFLADEEVVFPHGPAIGGQALASQLLTRAVIPAPESGPTSAPDAASRRWP